MPRVSINEADIAEIKETFGFNVYRRRSSLDMTQRDLAELIFGSCEKQYMNKIGYWERGKFLPLTVQLPRIARALQVSIDWLFVKEP